MIHGLNFKTSFLNFVFGKDLDTGLAYKYISLEHERNKGGVFGLD